MTLELVARGQGAWEVVAPGLGRIGTVLGAMKKWSAEIGPSHLGSYATRKQALQAIEEHRPVVALIAAMKAELARTGHLQHYQKDFDIDQDMLVRCATALNAVWVTRPMGTHLIMLDLPSTARELEGTLEALRGAGEHAIYWLDTARAQVKALTADQARSLARKAPRYQLHGTRVLCEGKSVATFKLQGSSYGMFRPTDVCVTVVTERQPTAPLREILRACVAEYAVAQTGTLFAAIKEIRFEQSAPGFPA